MSERGGSAEPLTDLQVEIRQEQAATLLRISRTLTDLVAELERERAKVGRLAGDERAAATAGYDRLRERAELWFWYLVVQREAVGLRHQQGLEELYPIPPPLDG